MKLEELIAIIKSEERVFIKFYAPWCGVCQLLTPYIESLKTDPNYNKIKWIDVDVEANTDIKDAFKINTLPYFTGLKNGKVLNEFSTSKKQTIAELANDIAS